MDNIDLRRSDKMETLVKEGQKYIMNTYGRLPVVFEKGAGCYIWDKKGKKYLDFVAGIAVNSLGHCHPEIVEAIKKQAEKLIHCSNLYWIESQVKLGKLLATNSSCDKVFFCNSGTEANEAAIKLARKWGKGRYEIITMEKSFHGRTLGALAATGQEKYRKDFQPTLKGFKYVPFNDLKALKESISDNTCAIMLEPIQGEGGVNVPEPGYLQEVQALCNANNLLLIVDEVQTGVGRTGESFGYKNFGIEPDIITLAKALGGGVPIGAMLAKEEIAQIFQPGDHASTFGGNPLVTSAALAAINILFEKEFLQEVKEKGAYFQEKLLKLKNKYNFIKKVKGIGLIIGCELDIEGQEIVNKCFQKGLIINCVGGHILRFVPPLIVTYSQIDTAIDILAEVFEEV